MSTAAGSCNKKNNTLVICLSPYAGGMELDAIKIAKLLCERVGIVLVAKKGCFIEGYYNNQMGDPGFKLETINFNSHFSFAIVLGVRKLIQKYSIGNVIFLGASEIRSLYFAFLGKDLNVIVRHGTTKSHPKKDLLHQLVYSCVNYHVAICEHLAKNVEYIVPFAKNTHLKVIYPSLRHVPPMAEKYSSENDKPIMLLHVGRITEGKGQIEAISACQILYEKNILFVLRCVGELDRGYEQEFRELLNSVPYSNSVEIENYTDDINQYYQNSAIFIFPSKGEGLSNAFIEALASGLICIAYNNTSFPELMELGFPILLAENQNIEALKGRLIEAVKKLKKTCLPLREQSDLAKKIFSADRERNEYLDILQ
jgi:glycosyltransferase involved in cell wall biosynthesis